MAKKIAIFIDAENTTSPSALKKVFEFIQNADYIAVCIKAFGDFSRPNLAPFKSLQINYGIDTVQCYSHGKNTTDQHLYIHCLETLYTTEVDTFAIIASDADYLPLIGRLQQSKQVLVFAAHNCNANLKSLSGYICIDEAPEKKPTLQKKSTAENTASPIYKDLITALREAHNELQDRDGKASLNDVGNFLATHYPDYAKTKGGKTLTALIESSGFFVVSLNRDNKSAMSYNPHY